jgi:hypothetical protein
MTDDQLEELLGRHRLTAPHPSLRARVLDASTGEPVRVRLGIVDYAIGGFAAGLLLTVTFMDAPMPPPSAEAIRQREISEVAEALGGGPDAMRYAAVVVSREDEPADPSLVEGAW